MSSRRIRTILYGDQRIEATELDLLHTPALQRLYDLHQLGLTDRVFVDASHSRIHHVIGVLEQVDNILQAITTNLEGEPAHRALDYHNAGAAATYTPKELANYIRPRRRATRLMGLLHDLTHAPFGHTLEDEIELQPQKHDHPERQAEAFYRLLIQYVGWLCLDDGHFDDNVQSTAQEIDGLFRGSIEQPGSTRIPEDPAFIHHVASLASTFLSEPKPARAMQRAPGPAQLVQLFRDLRFAMRALLWIDALHKDRLDDLLPPNDSHKRTIRPSGSYAFEKLIDETLRRAGQPITPDVDGFILQRDAFLLDVIGNTICADLLDYAKRDSLFAGLRLDYDVDRIVENFTVVSHRRKRNLNDSSARAYRTVEPILRTAISMFSHKLRVDAPGELMNLLQVRFYVYQRVLFHPTKCIAGAMLGSAIQLMGWHRSTEPTRPGGLPQQFRYVGDAVFLHQMSECATLATRLLQGLQLDSNDSVLEEHLGLLFGKLDTLPPLGTSSATRELLQARSTQTVVNVLDDLRAATRLLHRLASRRYHRGIFRLLPGDEVHELNIDAEQVAELFVDATMRAMAEREIESRCGLPRSSVTIHCPRSDGPKKIAEILMVGTTRDGAVPQAYPLREIGKIDPKIFAKHETAIVALEEMYKSMWRLIVSVAPPYVAQHDQLNKRIGRVLFAYLSGVPYENIYGKATEDELDAIDSLKTVPNDPRMESELRIANTDGSETPNHVTIEYPDGRREQSPLSFLRVADAAVARLRAVDPRIATALDNGDRDTPALGRPMLEGILEEAIPGHKGEALTLSSEPHGPPLRKAARTTQRRPQPSAHIEDGLDGLPMSDAQIFAGMMGGLSAGKAGSRRRAVFLEWAETAHLLPLSRSRRAVGFLEFLFQTVSTHHHESSVYSVPDLDFWFEEFSAGHQPPGTKR